MRVISLDMDGVLADFQSRCIDLIGTTLDTFPDSQSGWDALGSMRFNMYKNLDPMPDAHDLVHGCASLAYKHGCTIGVLTAVPKYDRVPLAKQHKKEWLAKHFPNLLFDFNIGPWAEHKQFHCQKGDILIDDSKTNIPQWNARGGFGILHVSAEDSLKRLKEYLESTTDGN